MSSCQNVSGMIPTRFILVILLFFATSISYMLRSDISMTIVAMVNKTALAEIERDNNNENDTDRNYDDGSCPVLASTDNNSDYSIPTFLEGEYVWNSKIQGYILGGFFYGYASTMFLAGGLAEKFGPKWFLGGGIFLGSILTALVPLVAKLGYGPLIALRVLTGMTQAVVFPGMSALIPKWFPVSERSRAYSIGASGAFAGIIIAMPFVAWLCNHGFAGGWPSVFYIFGISGVTWCVFWFTLSANSPICHSRISESEKKYILDALPSPCKKLKVQWKSMLTSFRVWAYIFALGANSWTSYTRLNDMPNFLDELLHIPIEKNGEILALLYTCGCITSLASGFVADFLINRNYLSITNTRKLFECLALIGSSCCLLAVTQSGCNVTAVICWLAVASSLQGISSSSDSILPIDMAPNFSGTLLGFGNTFSAVAGFLAPLVAGYILSFNEISMTLRWYYVLYTASGLSIIASIVCVLFWSADVQPWNEVQEEDEQEIVQRKMSKNSIA